MIWAGQGSGTGEGACPRQGVASHSFHFLLPPLEMGTVWGAGQGFLPRSELRMYQSGSMDCLGHDSRTKVEYCH